MSLVPDMEKEEIQEKQNHKKGVTIKSLLNTVFIVAVVIISVTATLIHEYFPKQSQEYKDHYSTYYDIVDERDKELESIILKISELSPEGELLASEYLQAKETSKCKLDVYHSKRKKILKDQSVIGYTSLKNFYLEVGIRVFAFVVCLFFFYKVIKTKDHKNKKRWEIGIATTFLLCASYWVSWAFLYKVNTKGEYDFERFTYDFYLYGLPVIVVIASYFIFKYKKSSEEKYREAKLNHILDVRDFLERLTFNISKLININKRTEFLQEKEDTINDIRLK